MLGKWIPSVRTKGTNTEIKTAAELVRIAFAWSYAEDDIKKRRLSKRTGTSTSRSCFIDMLWLSLLSCMLSAGALLLGLEGVATNTAMAAVRLFALAGALFAGIALYLDLTSWLRRLRAAPST